MFRSLFTVGIITTMMVSSACAEPTYYNGTIENRGDELRFRLTIDPDDAAATTLDIPQLWYAEVPIEAVQRDGYGIVANFPFGLGTLEFVQSGSHWITDGDPFHALLQEASAPPYTKIDMTFSAQGPNLEGTLYLPDGQGPFPAVIIVGGSAASQRGSWSYRSRADYYARMGVAAFVYDRRSFDGQFVSGVSPDFWSDAADIDAARDVLVLRDDISEVGLHGSSQGVWLSTIAQADHGDFAFLVMTGVPAVTPGDQATHSLIYGMRDDGLDENLIADAVAYQRLYFSVAHNLTGWDALVDAMAAAEGQDWYQYVDQPRTIEDLHWWNRHLAYEPRDFLIQTRIPILAMTGAGDWIAPPVENLPKLELYAAIAGNENMVILTLPNADHRLERGFETDEEGQWHWFEIAVEARAAIPDFLENQVGLELGR